MRILVAITMAAALFVAARGQQQTLSDGDIEAAINHFVALPTEGPEALEDRAEGHPVFAVR